MAVTYYPPSKTYFFSGTTTEKNASTLAKAPGARWFDYTDKKFYRYDSVDGWEFEEEYVPCVCNDEPANPLSSPIFKTSNTAIIGTTFVNDPDFKFPVVANEKVLFTMFLLYEVAGASEFSYTFSVPSGAKLFFENVGANDSMSLSQFGALSNGDIITLGATNAPRIAVVHGSIENSTTAGDVMLSFGQTESVSGEAKVLAGSWLNVFKA